MGPLEDHDWRILLRSISQGKSVLVLGPQVAIDPADAEPTLLQDKLVRRLTNELRESGNDENLVNPDELPHVAEVYSRETRRKRPGLELEVEDFYAPIRGKTTPLHLDLAALPFTLCVTITPERFLYNAFAQTAGKKPLYDFYHFRPESSRGAERPRLVAPPERDPSCSPLTYDLFGSLDHLDSLVLSDSDLLDFLVNAARGAPPLNEYVASRFTDPRTSFLFVGFGFAQWYVRILLHVLTGGNENQPSLAIETPAFFNDPEQRETIFSFQNGYLIDFRGPPTHEFARELRERFEKEYPPGASEQKGMTASPLASPAPAAPSPDAPVAFLCHESRDKPLVEEVAAQLEARGIRIWLDKQNLRGGDSWPQLIPQVIEKQAHYFIVLQSPRMLDKPESYFFREIKLAMERQEGFAPGLRFMLPAILERDPQLPLAALSKVHCLDLTESGGIDNLATAILEDWKQRPVRKTP